MIGANSATIAGEKAAKRKLLLSGYLSSVKDTDARKRYLAKLSIIGGIDPYETERKQWKDDVDMWPSITHVNVGMYLLVTLSPYTGEDLLNYKSLDCYRSFLAGWVREILVMSMINASGEERRIVIAKVRHSACTDAYAYSGR